MVDYFSDKRMAENMPMLVNSEQNMLNDLSNGKPTFTQRFETFVSGLKLIKFSMKLMDILKKRNVDISEINANFAMVFASGHPALSFPFLAPPNYKYLGFSVQSHYKTKTLPEELLHFIDNCENRHIIYASFGSMLSDPETLNWVGKLFKKLLLKDVCLLFRAKSGFQEHLSLPETRVYTQTWMPQKDILASKKAAFFISHCGNNGRLESIFYNVPILCIPLFADQYRNALLVKQKQFGKVLTKEEVIDEENAVGRSVDAMLENRAMYEKNMAIAKEIVLEDPGSGRDTFLFHINHIIKHGNADYLKNRILLEQSTVEIYNLDIIVPILIILIFVIIFSMYFVLKLFKVIVRKVSAKLKTE